MTINATIDLADWAASSGMTMLSDEFDTEGWRLSVYIPQSKLRGENALYPSDIILLLFDSAGDRASLKNGLYADTADAGMPSGGAPILGVTTPSTIDKQRIIAKALAQYAINITGVENELPETHGEGGAYTKTPEIASPQLSGFLSTDYKFTLCYKVALLVPKYPASDAIGPTEVLGATALKMAGGTDGGKYYDYEAVGSSFAELHDMPYGDFLEELGSVLGTTDDYPVSDPSWTLHGDDSTDTYPQLDWNRIYAAFGAPVLVEESGVGTDRYESYEVTGIASAVASGGSIYDSYYGMDYECTIAHEAVGIDYSDQIMLNDDGTAIAYDAAEMLHSAESYRLNGKNAETEPSMAYHFVDLDDSVQTQLSYTANWQKVMNNRFCADLSTGAMSAAAIDQARSSGFNKLPYMESEDLIARVGKICDQIALELETTSLPKRFINKVQRRLPMSDNNVSAFTSFASQPIEDALAMKDMFYGESTEMMYTSPDEGSTYDTGDESMDAGGGGTPS